MTKIIQLDQIEAELLVSLYSDRSPISTKSRLFSRRIVGSNTASTEVLVQSALLAIISLYCKLSQEKNSAVRSSLVFYSIQNQQANLPCSQAHISEGLGIFYLQTNWGSWWCLPRTTVTESFESPDGCLSLWTGTHKKTMYMGMIQKRSERWLTDDEERLRAILNTTKSIFVFADFKMIDYLTMR